jgi:3-hydroxymyristoyl/3-hydroxydecanoyl-(acyl carrier protein) dehydratase
MAHLRDVDPTTLIPHRPPIVAVDRLLYVDRSQARGERLVTVHSGLRPGGSLLGDELLEVHLIEGLAQTAGGVNGFDARETGRTTRAGWLVGIRNFAIQRRPRIGERVEFEVKILKKLGELVLFDCRASVGDETIAAGEMKFFVENLP